MLDTGTNLGISGMCNFLGVGGGPFNVFIRGFRDTVAGQELDISGRGDDWLGEFITYLASGTLVISGDPQLEQCPVSADFIDRTGTIDVCLVGTAKQTIAVKCTGCEISRGSKASKTLWDVSLTCRIMDMPTWTGWLAQAANATAGTPRSPKELYQGTSKSVDPDGLQTTETRRIVFFNPTDTDAGEHAHIATALALTPPKADVKARSATFTRLSAAIGFVSVSYGLTSTAEDVVNAGTTTTIDQSGLETVGTVTTINDSTPTAPAGQVVRKITSRELNDGNIQYDAETGLESVQAERERKATESDVDANQIVCRARTGIINATQPATPTAPAGTLLHHVESRKQEDGRFLWIFDFRSRDSKQEIEFDSVVSVDASTLESRAELIVVQSSDSPSAPATPFTGGVYTDYRRKVLMSTGSVAKYIYTYLYAYETNATRMAREVGSVTDDPQDIDDVTIIGVMDSATPPATPSGLKLVDSERKEYPNSHYRIIWKFGRTDSKDRIEYQGHIDVDASTIDSEAVVIQLQSNQTISAPSTPFTGGVFVRSSISQVTPAKWAVRYHFAYETNADRIAREASHAVADPAGLEDSATVSLVDATPSAPSGLKVVETVTRNLPNGHTQTTIKAAYADNEEKIEAAGTSTLTESSGMRPEARVTLMGATQPTTPTNPLGVGELWGIDYKPNTSNPAKGEYTFIFKARTQLHEVEDDGTITTVDPAGIKSEAQIAVGADTSTPPSDPAAPITSQVVTRRTTRRQGLKWVHTFYFGYETSAQQIAREDTITELDASTLKAKGYANISLVDTTEPSVPDSPDASLKYITKTVKPLQNGRFEWTFHYGVMSSNEEIGISHETAVYSAEDAGFYQTYAVVANTGVNSIAVTYFAGNKSDVTFHSVKVHSITPAIALVVMSWKTNSLIANLQSECEWYFSPIRLDLSTGDIEVFIADVIHATGTKYWCLAKPQRMLAVTGVITVEKRVNLSGTFPGMFDNYYGTCNNATYLGCPAKTLSFIGIKCSANLTTGGTMPIRYTFKQNSLGWMADHGMEGWFMLDTGGAAPGTGWQAITGYGSFFDAVAVYPTSDYSGIV